MQIKIAKRYQLIPVRMAIIKKKNLQTIIVAGEDVAKMESSCTGDTATMENSMEVSLKTRNKTTVSPNNPTPGYIL